MQVINRTPFGKTAPLRKAQQNAHARIISIADQVRRAFVTPITGQELTYQEKERQAEAFLAASPVPDPAHPEDLRDFGFIFGEVGITSQTAFQVATIILHKRDVMRDIGPAIERLRLKAAVQVDAAPDAAAVDQAFADYENSMDAIARV